MLLDVIAVAKSYGREVVLHSVSLHVDTGETLCLLGPSGCGKTTLLRMIAGLEAADSGTILLNGQPLEHVPVHERGFGLMFQDYALFPHKDVAANVAFGLRMQRLEASQVRARVREMLELVGLVGYERRRVFDLSGGEQQRVALARSLAPRPRLLMLDEPLGSLDRALREELLHELAAILRRVGVTSIYVTHDQQEAFSIAGRVLIMHSGRILQQGTPEAVYRQPSSAWVARFLGLANLVQGRVVGTEPLEVETGLGRFLPHPASPDELAAPSGDSEGALTKSTTRVRVPALGQPVTLLIRPEAARLQADCPEKDARLLEALVQECSFRGAHYRLVIRHESGQVLVFEVSAGTAPLPRPGEPVALALGSQGIGILPEQGEAFD